MWYSFLRKSIFQKLTARVFNALRVDLPNLEDKLFVWFIIE